MALARYQDGIPAARASYFRTHRAASRRRTFVTNQNKTLADLIRAASCELPPPPPGFTVVAAPGVDATAVRAALTIAPPYYERLGVPSFGTTIYVYGSRAAAERGYKVVTGASKQDASDLWSTATAAGSLDGIFVNAGSDGWKQRSVVERERIVAHELFHAAQNALADAGWDVASGVPWLAEGSAEYFGTAALVNAGLTTFAAHDVDLAFVGADAPLSAYQDSSGYSRHGLYSIGYLAVERLVQLHGASSVLAFYRDLASGVVSWRDAFNMAFGETVDQFYAEFSR